MQANEFENKMQQKLEAFQLHPSEAVWQKVQLNVAKEKEHKRKYLLISFLLLVLLASTLWVADLENHSASFNATAGNETGKVLPQEDAKIKLPMKPSSMNMQEMVTQTSINNNTDNKKQQQNIVTVTAGKRTYRKIQANTKGTAAINIFPAVVSEQPQEKSENSVAEKDQFIEKKMALGNETALGKGASVTQELNKQLPGATPIENNEAVKTVHPVSPKSKKQRWNTSFLLAIGKSATGNKYLGEKALADYYSNVGNTPTSGNNSGNNTPSATKGGFSFIAGFQLSRTLSAKSSVGAGLQYQLLTTSISTGEKINTQSAPGSAVAFQSGNSNRYTSFFHSITLPVFLSSQIATIKDRQINVGIGVNFSRLLYTNALLFDFAQGSYYSNEDVFNKMLVGVSGSVVINLAGKDKAPFYLGPDFNYSLTPLAATGMYSNAHVSFWGIRLQKMLQKNK